MTEKGDHVREKSVKEIEIGIVIGIAETGIVTEIVIAKKEESGHLLQLVYPEFGSHLEKVLVH